MVQVTAVPVVGEGAVNILLLLVLEGQVPVDGATVVMALTIVLPVARAKLMGEAEAEEITLARVVPVLLV